MPTLQQRITEAIERSPLWRYLLTGGLISLIDFSGYSLATIAFGVNEVIANVVSTTVAMSVSFFINSTFVFRSSKRTVSSFITFVGFTAFTGFGLQSLVIVACVSLGNLVVGPGLRDAVVLAAKIIAMAVGAVANFLGYRFLFTRKPRGRNLNF